uniref:Putative secreted protein n=1 Tax=Ixodes ricinus TaxID=34613 RepID=A0A6B0UR90_IXORI
MAASRMRGTLSEICLLGRLMATIDDCCHLWSPTPGALDETAVSTVPTNPISRCAHGSPLPWCGMTTVQHGRCDPHAFFQMRGVYTTRRATFGSVVCAGVNEWRQIILISKVFSATVNWHACSQAAMAVVR